MFLEEVLAHEFVHFSGLDPFPMSDPIGGFDLGAETAAIIYANSITQQLGLPPVPVGSSFAMHLTVFVPRYSDLQSGQSIPVLAGSQYQRPALQSGDQLPLEQFEFEQFFRNYPIKCFAAGTFIRMVDGGDVPIEYIKTGDMVLAFDGEGIARPARVASRLRGTTNQWIELDDGTCYPRTPISAARRFIRRNI
jgi:hypothetical protein